VKDIKCFTFNSFTSEHACRSYGFPNIPSSDTSFSVRYVPTIVPPCHLFHVHNYFPHNSTSERQFVQKIFSSFFTYYESHRSWLQLNVFLTQGNCSALTTFFIVTNISVVTNTVLLRRIQYQYSTTFISAYYCCKILSPHSLHNIKTIVWNKYKGNIQGWHFILTRSYFLLAAGETKGARAPVSSCPKNASTVPSEE
jgi:hypothetical protein